MRRATKLQYVGVEVPLSELLLSPPDELERYVLCGELESVSDMRAWLLAVPAGWSARIIQCRSNGMVEAYYTRDDGRRIRVRSAAEWFGPGLTVGEVPALFDRLQWHLAREFVGRKTPAPLVSPQVCGRALWKGTEPWGDLYDPLPEEIQNLIRATCGQGRREVLAAPELQELPAFWYWDMKLAYPAFMENLPVGPATWVDGMPAGYGWVNVRFTVPKGWEHVGLLPVKVAQIGHHWPTEGTHETWCNPAEVRQAESQGWRVEFLQGLAMPEGKPLNAWSRRLKRLYERFEEMGEDRLKRAARAILLHTLGDYHGRGRVIERDVRNARGATVSRQGQGPTRVDSHPEWTSAVWSRCRYRLTRYLLSAPRGILLGCYGDAAYTLADPGWGNPAWGQGTLGHMRLKGRLQASGRCRLPAPRIEADLFELAARATAAHEDLVAWCDAEEEREEAEELATDG